MAGHAIIARGEDALASSMKQEHSVKLV